MSHTPGPWMATRSLHDTRVIICTEHGHRIDVASTYAAGCGVPVEANARLIAAAPELLEALQRAERQIVALYRAATPHGNYGANNDGSDLNQSAFADQDETVIAARAAIAKATGAGA